MVSSIFEYAWRNTRIFASFLQEQRIEVQRLFLSRISISKNVVVKYVTKDTLVLLDDDKCIYLAENNNPLGKEALALLALGTDVIMTVLTYNHIPWVIGYKRK